MARGRKPTAITLARDKAIEKAGGIEAVYSLVESGMTMAQICEQLQIDTGRVSSHAMRQLLKRDAARWDTAKEASVEALAERAYEEFGAEAPVTAADSSWRANKSKYWTWLAGVRGGMNESGVTINIQSLHLEALKAAGSRQVLQTQRGPANATRAFLEAGPVVNAEVVTDE
jgi:hypothetical protein